ncbi:MAG TPA: class I SAM-dependent methyltransferase [Baekduia sp.]|nr:class I SAM-dependent methyltransferase [Baekduia sp.]
MRDESHQQQYQPPGVPPLTLSGERTLPDVPAENYWLRRHLAVYEWVRTRVGGLDVIDMATGEGYGADELARTAASVVGVDASAEAFEHARLRYTAPNLRFAHARVEEFAEPCDAIVCLQAIEHLSDPNAALKHFRSFLGPNGVAYISTPNVLTLAPDGVRSDNPWHMHEYRPEEFEALLLAHFGSVDLFGLFHARKLAAHQFALENLSWDRVHEKLGMTKQFYDRFLPSLTTEDFVLHRMDSSFLGKALDVVAVCRP